MKKEIKTIAENENTIHLGEDDVRANEEKTGNTIHLGEEEVKVEVKENESLDSALRRFKRQTSRDGVIQEVRKREHYEKPSVKRKKKSEAARKRKYK